MAHELDFSKGQAAIAYRGATPWHGLGESILPQDDVNTIRIKAGLDYDVVKTPVQYTREAGDLVDAVAELRHGPLLTTSAEKCVLYRSDTGDDLSVVSSKYQVVQPKEIIDFYRDLTEKFGFELEVVGALKGGRKVWALANTGNAFQLRDRDDIKGYLLLATSYDGSMATQARFTSVRVVCNNTLTLADRMGKADVTVPHSTKFNAEKVKEQLRIGPAWERFQIDAQNMSQRIIGRDETVKLFLDVYYGLDSVDKIRAFQADEKNNKAAEKFIGRMTENLFNSPGANLASARGTLWGALQAITYDVDHALPARSQNSRLDKAWFGTGEAIKRRAWERARSLLVA